MDNVLKNLEPKALWKIFEDICSIPHPSKNEAHIIDYVKTFGERLGLDTVVDDVGNVVIRKSATPGMEGCKTVVLQGHLDMVPQKNNDTVHDFLNDPIQPVIDGDWVRARGTTLGADNGIGVAAAMAVLQDKDLVHGPLECLFTIDEETGMTGAFGLKPGLLHGDILINLDSEDEGELYIGCAGGIDTNAVFTFNQDQVPNDSSAYCIEVKGLKGGHSGLDIHLGRGNANKLLNRLLWQAGRECGLRLASISGGSLRNAIPREASAVVVVPKDESATFEAMAEKLQTAIKIELSAADPGFQMLVTKTDKPEFLIDSESSTRFFNAIYGCPNGVIRMVTEMPDIVETSTNLAIIESRNNTIEVSALQRSSVDTAKEDLCNMMRAVFEQAGAKVVHEGAYPGWKPNVESPILKTMKKVYHDKFGKTPEQKVIHAGLECGLLGGVYPNLDMISFGPTIRNPHSPDEMVKIDTVAKFYEFLTETLRNIPA
jgi:dipeptidase D